MNGAELFFDSYNMSFEAAYDAYLKIVGGDFSGVDENPESKLRPYLHNEYQKWLSTPLENLDGKTPVEFLETADSLHALTEMFYCGAVVCDEELPEIFLNKLRSYGESAVDMLLKAAQNDGCSSEEGILVPSMAVKILGSWQVERAVEPLIKLLDTGEAVCDLMYENVRDALILIGKPALDGIFSALNSGSLPQAAAEYLLIALSDIGKKNRCDKIYQQLKKAFLEYPEKLIAAYCLRNYGDGRAIPALRGFLEKNAMKLDKETFYEVVSAIKHLGGNIEDLNYTN